MRPGQIIHHGTPVLALPLLHMTLKVSMDGRVKGVA